MHSNVFDFDVILVPGCCLSTLARPFSVMMNLIVPNAAGVVEVEDDVDFQSALVAIVSMSIRVAPFSFGVLPFVIQTLLFGSFVVVVVVEVVIIVAVNEDSELSIEVEVVVVEDEDDEGNGLNAKTAISSPRLTIVVPLVGFEEDDDEG